MTKSDTLFASRLLIEIPPRPQRPGPGHRPALRAFCLGPPSAVALLLADPRSASRRPVRVRRCSAQPQVARLSGVHSPWLPACPYCRPTPRSPSRTSHLPTPRPSHSCAHGRCSKPSARAHSARPFPTPANTHTHAQSHAQTHTRRWLPALHARAAFSPLRLGDSSGSAGAGPPAPLLSVTAFSSA